MTSDKAGQSPRSQEPVAAEAVHPEGEPFLHSRAGADEPVNEGNAGAQTNAPAQHVSPRAADESDGADNAHASDASNPFDASDAADESSETDEFNAPDDQTARRA
ncbi:MAG: hypothetical protein CBCREVIR_0270 [Candidatus Burkholderia crenata]|nr:MAG: hypothetical protein CBCREVIR_0270 [Candidatus Burkholderia crenata]